MKLKYKKLIVLISACAMGIGLVTFSIAQPKDNTVNIEEQSNAELEDSVELADAAVKENEEAAAAISSARLASESETAKATEDVATEVPAIEDKLVKSEDKVVRTLIKNYLKAKLSKKVENFEGIVNDTSVITVEDLERQTNYIEKYSNLDIYTKNGPEEGSFVVYAYHEVKFTSIETLAPAMNMFYVKSNDAGEYYIYIGNVDDETAKFFDEMNQSEDVMELIYEVNDKMKDALEQDKHLAEFYTKLEETAKQVAQND